MFSVDSIIDAVQTTKKQVIKTVVTDETIARGLNEMVDTQTAFTKAAVNTGKDVSLKMVEEGNRAAEEFSKHVKTVMDNLGKSVFVKDFDKAGRDAVDLFWKEAGKFFNPNAFGYQHYPTAFGSKAKAQAEA